MRRVIAVAVMAVLIVAGFWVGIAMEDYPWHPTEPPMSREAGLR
jgi:hypothetical protein